MPNHYKPKYKKWLKNNQVIFVNKIPSNSFKCDIVNASSSMQYIDDWKGLLKSFQNYKPEFMIFSEMRKQH